jgi:hypothetical protein
MCLYDTARKKIFFSENFRIWPDGWLIGNIPLPFVSLWGRGGLPKNSKKESPTRGWTISSKTYNHEDFNHFLSNHVNHSNHCCYDRQLDATHLMVSRLGTAQSCNGVDFVLQQCLW